MNTGRGGYAFFPHPPPQSLPLNGALPGNNGGGVGGNPFLSFVGPPSNLPPVNYPYPPHQFPRGFPIPLNPGDLDPSHMVSLQLPFTQPPTNDAFQNFIQPLQFLPHNPPLPLTVRSGVYDLRAVEAHMANSLKEGQASEYLQPLSVAPPPRGHFAEASSTDQGSLPITSPPPRTKTPPSSVVPSAPGVSGVVSDDPTTYWLGIDSNDSPKESGNGRANGNRRTRTRNNKDSNNATNTNTSNTNGTANNSPVITTTTTTASSNNTNSPSNNTHTGRKNFNANNTATSVTGDFPRNNHNKSRQLHTNRNTTKQYVPKQSDLNLANLKIDLNPGPTVALEIDKLAEALQKELATSPETELTIIESTPINQNDDAITTTDLLVDPVNPSVTVLQRFTLPSAAMTELISVDCKSIFEALQPPRSDLHAKLAFLSRLQRIVEGHWPNYSPKLHMFGSSANEMCFINGDIDMCLTIDKDAGSEKYIVNKLSRLLTNKGMQSVKALPHARVPIVKFKDPKSRFLCDICINNALALQNTRLVADYSKIDPRVRPLAYLVKYWAKRRGINNPYQGTLSSYAYINLVLNFLQTRDPPILPSLQALAAEEPTRNIVDEYDCTYVNPLSYVGYGAPNQISMAELLCQFFHYYTNEFDVRNAVISVRTGRLLSKREKGWDSKFSRDNMLLTIEDPFETTHNLGRLVDKEGLHMIMSELRRACILLRNEGSFVAVCKEKAV